MECDVRREVTRACGSKLACLPHIPQARGDLEVRSSRPGAAPAYLTRTGKLTILARRFESPNAVVAARTGFICRPAATRAERTAAFRIVYEAYLQAGLIEPNPHRLRVTPYQLLPTTDIFIALDGERPIATVSLVRDGDAGLPCETLFPRETAQRRRRGSSLGEACSLAMAATDLPHRLALLGMMRVLAQTARRRKVDELLAAVHPRHASFYQHALCFEAFGATVPHRQLRNRPAVGLALSFPRVDRLRPRSYALFFDAPLSHAAPEAPAISDDELAFFRDVAERCHCGFPSHSGEDRAFRHPA